MYVRLKTGKGFTRLVPYLFKEEREVPARIIGSNIPTDDQKEIMDTLDEVASQRPRVRSPVVHGIVSWHQDDQVSDEKMAEVGRRLLDSIDLPEEHHQYILVRHDDTDNTHMHIVANRVGFDGRVQDPTHFPAIRMRHEATKLDIENGFTTGQAALSAARKRGLEVPAAAAGVAPGRDPTPNVEERSLFLREGKTAKHEVYSAVKEAIAKSDGSFAALDLEVRKRGVAPAWSFNSQGEFNGASFTLLSSDATHPLLRKGDESTPFMGQSYTFKGSQLGPKPGLSKDYIVKALDGRREAADRKAARQRSKEELREARRAESAQFRAALRAHHQHQEPPRRSVVGKAPANLNRVISAYLRPLSAGAFFRGLSMFQQPAVPHFVIPRSAFTRSKRS